MQSTSPTQLWATGEETKVRVSRARKLVLTAGLLSGLISFGIGEAIYNLIPPQRVPQKIRMSNIEVLLPSRHTENAAAAKNAALAFGLLGTCLGGLLGMAGGLARQSKSATVTAGFLVRHSHPPWGGCFVVLPYGLQAQLDHTDNDLAIALAMHCLSWGPLGAAAGLAFAAGLGQKGMAIQTVTAGLTGALGRNGLLRIDRHRVLLVRGDYLSYRDHMAHSTHGTSPGHYRHGCNSGTDPSHAPVRDIFRGTDTLMPSL